MNYDTMYNPYPSRRSTVFSQKGMVATSQSLAAQAGLDMLKKGGNAIDAAIATAACLTVVEPTSNGIGGDAFALVWTNGQLYGLNGSGPAPRAITGDIIKKAGHQAMPSYGWLPVTVPGTPAAWAELSKRFGKLPFSEVLKPAIEYAEQGYPVSPTISKLWGSAFNNYSKMAGDEFKSWMDTFAPAGRAPIAGEIWKSPAHARTLQQIAETQSEAFYRGCLAEAIDAYSRQYGG